MDTILTNDILNCCLGLKFFTTIAVPYKIQTYKVIQNNKKTAIINFLSNDILKSNCLGLTLFPIAVSFYYMN
jgi:hypothetical protein